MKNKIKETPEMNDKLVYHIVITSEQAIRELDGLIYKRNDMWCDYAQSLSSWKTENKQVLMIK